MGRDSEKPGLVVVLLNPNRPRDRSHYEHFAHSHDVFYRDVEATSVTPFSERALERALPAITVALARHLSDELTPANCAGDTEALAKIRESVAQALRRRVAIALVDANTDADARAANVADQVRHIIDDWCSIAHRRGRMEYGRKMVNYHHCCTSILNCWSLKMKNNTKANRSLRDVEPSALPKFRQQTTTRACHDDQKYNESSCW